MKPLVLLLSLCILPSARAVPLADGAAGPLERDLGRGLVYHRVHKLPADLPTADAARAQPWVLDLRYVTGDAGAAATLTAWLKFHATPRAPVILLANADTSAVLLAPLARRGVAGVVVVGAAAPGFAPDIAVKISADLERKAYDALEHGATIESLLTENADKPRNDEARLAKDRSADSSDTADSGGGASPSAGTDESAKPKSPPPLIDAALQRAVHLHRTLVALKKL